MDENYFKEKLNPEQYRVMRQKGTEVSHTGKYWDHGEQGIYLCAACNTPLFLSLHKFDFKDGWPSFKRPASSDNLVLQEEANGDREVSCKKCGSHLGYIGKQNEHYTVNSIALGFQALPDIEWEEGEKEKKEKGEGRADAAPASAGKGFVKTLSLTLGGLTLGVAVGVGASPLITPQTACIDTAPELTQAAPPQEAEAANVPPRIIAAPAPQAVLAPQGTPVPATSSPAVSTSSATGVPGSR